MLTVINSNGQSKAGKGDKGVLQALTEVTFGVRT